MLHGDLQPAELDLKTVSLQDLTCQFMIRSDRSPDLFTSQNSNCLIILYVLAENVKINCKIKHKMCQFYLE